MAYLRTSRQDKGITSMMIREMYQVEFVPVPGNFDLSMTRETCYITHYQSYKSKEYNLTAY